MLAVSLKRNQASSRGARWLLFVLLAATCGCRQGPGYETATVVGKVTIDGAAVPKGYVTFTPAVGTPGPVTGGAIVDGAYRCESVPVGDHTATLIAQAAEMTTILDVSSGQEQLVPRDILPAAYRNGVAVTIDPGEIVLDFALKGN